MTAAVVARRGAVITGPPGVGKTTLAMTGVELAQDRGRSLARTTATRASRRLPFGAFASFLPPDPGGDRFSRQDHGELLRRYVRAVVDGAGGKPLVVFVDDAHLLDDGSALLLQQLALTGAATVLATVRSGEPAPDPVVALWKDGPAERIELGVLDDAAVEELLVSALGAPVDPASMRQLIQRSQGNPLFLRELVTGALETGELVEEVVGMWRLRGDLHPTERLVEMAAQRLADLTGPERAVLELLTLGEPLELVELDQLAEPAAVETLERKGLITSRVDGCRVRMWLSHPIFGDVLSVGISAVRERAIARSLAELIETPGGPRRNDTLLLASLRLIGGGGSPKLLLSGAISARAHHDYSLAERLARAAVEEGGGFEARLVAAEAAHAQGRPKQAEDELTALAAQAVSDAEQARVALLRFDNAYLLQGCANLRLIDDAADAITDRFWHDELMTRRFLVMSTTSGPRATVETASALLEGFGSRPLTAAHVAVSYSLIRLGRLDDAIQLLTPPPDSAAIPESDEPWDQWALFVARVVALVYAGRFGEAEELLTVAYSRVVDQPAAEARAYVAGWFAVLHLETGCAMSAFRRAGESYTLFRQLGRTVPAGLSCVAGAQAFALTGQADRATETLTARDALGLPTVPVTETDLLAARAWTAVAAGNLPAARQLLERAADYGEEVGDLIGATSALHGLARLGQARHVATRLAALADEVDGDLVAARVAYTNGVAARNADALNQVSSDFEDLGALLYAGEARAEAAVVLRHAGRAREGAAAERHAARLLARCEGAATPPVRLIMARVRLTPAELDAAVHAAAGRSNKQIAGDMHLSVRTVESHLQRVYEKLAVSGRHELADALPDHKPI
ncbi:MAG: transcriptional regulator, LuxR family [Mycobacterium sp.]|nr:transcriptional regulator, LuxR family [Mycobacterium sp.]